jgi:mono/diheme cytochrome c family protein
MMPLRAIRPLAVAALVVVAPRTILAQTDSSAGGTAPSRSTRDSVYTAAQAARGAALFHDVCAQCHTTSQFTGPTFTRSWSGRTAFDPFDLIRRTMPYDNPGGLADGREAYAEILAYVLRLNGYPAGERALPSDDASLKRVRIDAPPGGP